METDSGPGGTADPGGVEVQDIPRYPGMPGWVKVCGAIVAAVAVAFVFLRFTIGMHQG